MAHDHATVEVFADCDRNLGTRAVRVKGSLLDFALRGRVWLQREPGTPTTEPAHRAVCRIHHGRQPDRLPVLESQVKE
jgi:hypothetical protein